jgi:outer membrane protein assembly factor BamB
MRFMPVFAVFSVFVIQVMADGDWPAWRGPLQSGAQLQSGALADSLPSNTWKAVWESAPIPGDTEGGFGSPVVADGRVYLFCSWRTWTNLSVRRLTAGQAAQLGLLPPALPDAALSEIEAARVSPERLSLKGADVGKWAKAWVAAHAAVTQQVAFARFAEDRISRGDAAFPVDGLRCVTQIVDRTLPSPEALAAWFKEAGITNTLAGRIDQLIPKKTSSMEDVLLCLDAGDGRLLWKQAFPGRVSDWGSSSTPCVSRGSVFVMGSGGMAYGFDARTGGLQWTNAVASRVVSSSFISGGGRLYVQAGPLTALDPATGAVLWTQKAANNDNASAAFWKGAGTEQVIAGGGRLVCVNAADGTVAWSVPGGDSSTPAVLGDALAVQSGGGMLVYRLSPTGAVLVASIRNAGSRGASAAVADGKAYTTAEAQATCVDLGTGAVVWQVPGTAEQFASPVVADGKLVSLGSGGRLFLFDAASGKLLGSKKVDALRCTSPALAGTRVYIRTARGVRCYDLARAATAVSP